MSRFSLFPALLWICALLGCSCAAVQAADLPSPESFLGFRAGEDNQLADWDMMLDYFHQLDQASDCVMVEDIGRSTHGRKMILVTRAGTLNKSDTVDRFAIRRPYQFIFGNHLFHLDIGDNIRRGTIAKM